MLLRAQSHRCGCGGYFTDNHAFRLAAAPAPWDGPLVVRLFPSSIPPGSARREAAVQDVVAATWPGAAGGGGKA